MQDNNIFNNEIIENKEKVCEQQITDFDLFNIKLMNNIIYLYYLIIIIILSNFYSIKFILEGACPGRVLSFILRVPSLG